MKQIIILTLLITMIGCDKTDSGLNGESGLTIKLARSYSNVPSSSVNESEGVNTLRYFVCDNGKVSVVSKDLAGGESSITIRGKEMTTTSHIYVIANGELTGQMSAIGVGSDEAFFASLRSDQSGHNGQVEAIVMSAFASMSDLAAGSALTMHLQRNMARFDLNVKQGEGIEVVDVRVTGLATAGYLFESGQEISANTATYAGNFANPHTELVRGLFYAHPRAVGESAAVVEADVRFNGVLTTLTTSLREIKRNCIHTISISRTHIPPQGSISIEILASEMEQGDSDDTQPNNKATVTIDKAQSLLSEGVSVLDDGKRINLPYWGASATIAIAAPKGTILENIDGAVDGFTITPIPGEEFKYQISTSANTRIRSDKKAVLLNFTFANNTLENNYRIAVTIDNYASFPIVSFDQLEWMVYNAFSKYDIDYPMFPLGSNIREVYNSADRWAKFTGKGCQWGPRAGISGSGTQYMLPAWETQKYIQSDLANINGDIIGGSKTQVWESAVSPCPDGWRVPTYAEFQTIWPTHGTILKENTPAEYTTATGNSLSAVIETFGGNYPTHSHTTGISSAYAKNLIIKVGAAELIFPIAGYRTEDGAFRNPDTGKLFYTGLGSGMGTETYYWCGERSDKKYVAVGIADNVIQNIANDRTANMWYYQRCVRTMK